MFVIYWNIMWNQSIRTMNIINYELLLVSHYYGTADKQRSLSLWRQSCSHTSRCICPTCPSTWERRELSVFICVNLLPLPPCRIPLCRHVAAHCLSLKCACSSWMLLRLAWPGLPKSVPDLKSPGWKFSMFRDVSASRQGQQSGLTQLFERFCRWTPVMCLYVDFILSPLFPMVVNRLKCRLRFLSSQQG